MFKGLFAARGGPDPGCALAAPPSQVDYGKMWDNAKLASPPSQAGLNRLANQAGIPKKWMTVPAHRPDSRADFISKMNSAYYTDFAAAGPDEGKLPICVGFALTQVICAGMPAKYGKHVSPKAVLAALLAACPEMFEEGIRPNEAIDRCNQAHKQRGLIIPGSDNDVYWIRLQPQVFTHREFCQALTMVECSAKLGCRAMAVVVVPHLDVPLHAMVTSSVGYCNGAAISAFDLQDEEAEREQVITDENFHHLIVCNISASEQLRGETRELRVQAGFQEQFELDLNRSRRVTKLKAPGGCAPLGCGRAQMDELLFDPALLDSIQEAQNSFAQILLKFQALRDNFRKEFEGNFPKDLLDTFRKDAREAPLEAAQSLTRSLASRVSAANRDEQTLQRLVKVLEESGFDEEMIHGFRLGADDLLRSLARRCLV